MAAIQRENYSRSRSQVKSYFPLFILLFHVDRAAFHFDCGIPHNILSDIKN